MTESLRTRINRKNRELGWEWDKRGYKGNIQKQKRA